MDDFGMTSEWDETEAPAEDIVFSAEDLGLDTADVTEEVTDIEAGQETDLAEETNDVDTGQDIDPAGETDDMDTGEEIDPAEETDLRTDAEKAADHARACGADKAADYIERHFEGEFVEGEPIRISTRNEGLEGQTNDLGIPFSRREVELGDGLTVSGVFPEFESKFEINLGQDANDMTLSQQFGKCKEGLQNSLGNNLDKLGDIPIDAFDKLNSSYAPEGFTYHHEPETGRFTMTYEDLHGQTGHTGGNALWGK